MKSQNIILMKIKVNPKSKSFNLINNLSHPNFYLISKNKGKKKYRN